MKFIKKFKRFKRKYFLETINSALKIIIAVTLYTLIIAENDFFHYMYISIILVSFFLVSNTKIKKIISAIPFILYFWSFLAIISFITLNEEPYIINTNLIKISLEAFNNSLLILWRIILLYLTSFIILMEMQTEKLVYGIEIILSPLKKIKINTKILTTTILLALKSIPLLQDEFQNIQKAQEARGINIYSKNIFIKIKQIKMIIVPLLFSVFSRADELIITMNIRKYNPQKESTKMYNEKLKKRDIILSVFLVIVIQIYVLI